tara:strand:+ start:60 stop:527 length:468 start_codon:yes stop_codon:yes gene_type:complete
LLILRETFEKMVTTTPISWSFIQEFSWDLPPRIVLGRSQEVDDKYLQHRLYLSKNGITGYDNIMKLFVSDATYVLEHNNFPYYMEEGISHYVVWINPKDEETWKRNEIEELVTHELFEGNRESMLLDTVYFQNIPELRSIKAISHIHVFVTSSLV